MLIGRFFRNAVRSLAKLREEKNDGVGHKESAPADDRSRFNRLHPGGVDEAAGTSPLSRRLIWVTAGVIRKTGNGLTSDIASTRYRVLLPGSALEKLGWRSKFVIDGLHRTLGGWGSAAPGAGDTVLVSKVSSDHALQMAQDAKARGAKLIVDICDNYLDILESPEYQYLSAFFKGEARLRSRVQKTLLSLADGVVVSSESMVDVLEIHGRKPDAVIYDPVEMPKGEIKFLPGSSLRLLWYGHMVNILSLKKLLPQLAEYAKKQPLVLHVVSNLKKGKTDLERLAPSLEILYTPWSILATQKALTECDIVVIPVIDSKLKAAKSPNRLLEALWSGRFVVAGNLPVYQRFKDSAWIGDNLIEGLDWALDHPEEVWARVACGQHDIATHFTEKAIALEWENVITRVHKKTESENYEGSDVVLGTNESGTNSWHAYSLLQENESLTSASFGQENHQQGYKGLSVSNTPAMNATKTESEPYGRDGIKLNLGCGDKILPGYVNVDVVENRTGKKPDVLCDLHRLEPFADGSVNEILAVHVVEHFWRWEVLDVLKEWARVLKPGGKMILECPNLISACEEFLKNPEVAAKEGQEGQRSMWVFYGDPRWKDPYMVHRWGYTPKSLARLMEDAGLVNARQEPAQFKLREPRDMRVVSEKPFSGRACRPTQFTASKGKQVLGFSSFSSWHKLKQSGAERNFLPATLLTAPPLVSVVIPSFNHARYLQETLQSVDALRYPNIEVVVVDDASTDDSMEIINGWMANTCRKVVFEINKINLGLRETCKRAINVSNGKYISLMGSDDVYVATALDGVVDLLESDNDNVLFIGSGVAFKASGNITSANGKKLFEVLFKGPRYALEHFYTSVSTLFVQGMIFKKSFYQEIGGFPDVPSEDWGLVIKMFEHLQMRNTKYLLAPEKVIFGYRRHEANVSRDKRKQLVRKLLTIRKLTPKYLRKRALINVYQKGAKYRGENDPHRQHCHRKLQILRASCEDA